MLLLFLKMENVYPKLTSFCQNPQNQWGVCVCGVGWGGCFNIMLKYLCLKLPRKLNAALQPPPNKLISQDH